MVACCLSAPQLGNQRRWLVLMLPRDITVLYSPLMSQKTWWSLVPKVGLCYMYFAFMPFYACVSENCTDWLGQRALPNSPLGVKINTNHFFLTSFFCFFCFWLWMCACAVNCPAGECWVDFGVNVLGNQAIWQICACVVRDSYCNTTFTAGSQIPLISFARSLRAGRWTARCLGINRQL